MPFDGETYDRDRDQERLGSQLLRVAEVMIDGAWHSLPEMEEMTGDPKQSISARLRDMRKEKFGKCQIERRNIGGGNWEYRWIA